MGGPQQGALKHSVAINQDIANQYYGVIMPGMERRGEIAQQIIGQGGHPAYMTEGYEMGRGVLADSLTSRDNKLVADLMRMKQGQSGGNVGATMSGTSFGQKLAAAMNANRLQEAGSKLESINNLLGLQLNASGQAGSASLAATQNQIQSASMMPRTSPLADALVGGAALAGMGYGAYQAMQPTPGQSQFGGGFSSSFNPSGSLFSTGFNPAPSSFSLAGLGTPGAVFGGR